MCDTVHPERQVQCEVGQTDTDHQVHFAMVRHDGHIETVTWDNSDYIEPPKKLTKKEQIIQDGQKKLDAIKNNPSAEGTTTGVLHPETSHNAAFAALPDSGTKRRAVLDAVLEAGDWGMTDDELEAKLQFGLNTIRPRRVELIQGGWVEDSGDCRNSAKGLDSICWIATAKARELRGATLS